MAEPVLTLRALNRALLARQMLLRREEISPAKAVERLIGLQAQQPRPPFIGIWSRVESFESKALLKLLYDRKLVRATMMRGTLHLLSAGDYLAFRQTFQPALTAGRQSILRDRLAGIDVESVIAAAEKHFAQQPQTFSEARAALVAQFPGIDERAMGYIARMGLPLAMVPDGSEFGFGSDAQFVGAATWLGRPVETSDRTPDLLLRYLAAFGPATVADAQTWLGIPKLKPMFEALRPRLRILRDEDNRELFDLVGAPLPPEDTPSPVRFLPGFDNAILGHADRSRIIAEEHRPRVTTKNLQVLPTFLVDGFVAGTWEIAEKKNTATLALTPFRPLTVRVKKELTAEAEALANFLCGAATCQVQFGNV